MKRYKLWLFPLRARENFIFLAGCLMAVQIVNLIGVQTLSHGFGDRPLSLADGYLMMGAGYMFYLNLVFIPLLALSVTSRRDFTVNHILKYGNQRYLWVYEVLSAFLLVGFFAVYQLVCVTLWVLPKCGSLINFTQRRSVFAFMNNGRTLEAEPPFLQVVLAAFLFVLFAGLMFAVLFVNLKWLFSNLFPAFAVLLFMMLMDIGEVGGVCAHWGVSYHKWLEFNPANLLVPPLITGCLWALGYLGSKRKEFIHAK